MRLENRWLAATPAFKSIAPEKNSRTRCLKRSRIRSKNRLESRHAIGILGVSQDITDIKKLQEELAEQKEALLEAGYTFDKKFANIIYTERMKSLLEHGE